MRNFYINSSLGSGFEGCTTDSVCLVCELSDIFALELAPESIQVTLSVTSGDSVAGMTGG